MTATETTAASTDRTQGPRGTASERRTATVNLPFVTAQFRRPEMHVPRLPGRQEVGAAAGVAQSFLPPPERLVYYAGLGALAAFEVVEWPVAVAIAAGTAIAGRSRGRTWSAASPAGRPGPSGRAQSTEATEGEAAERAGSTGRGRAPGRRAKATPATAT
jgi:hypothetical protein